MAFGGLSAFVGGGTRSGAGPASVGPLSRAFGPPSLLSTAASMASASSSRRVSIASKRKACGGSCASLRLVKSVEAGLDRLSGSAVEGTGNVSPRFSVSAAVSSSCATSSFSTRNGKACGRLPPAELALVAGAPPSAVRVAGSSVSSAPMEEVFSATMPPCPPISPNSAIIWSTRRSKRSKASGLTPLMFPASAAWPKLPGRDRSTNATGAPAAAVAAAGAATSATPPLTAETGAAASTPTGAAVTAGAAAANAGAAPTGAAAASAGAAASSTFLHGARATSAGPALEASVIRLLTSTPTFSAMIITLLANSEMSFRLS
mmetsp:Transcript_45704/g.99601  ORF Transcript_45704/g.99601 Transcript_45704/m.99601 type:complete len:319 (+) Transcript_45704:400-1356(+)